MTSIQTKADFEARLQQFAATLLDHITDNGAWKIKGIIDSSQQIYALSLDTKTLSKILEVQITPHLETFAAENGFEIVLAEHQNYYPDYSFVSREGSDLRFAVDLKTTYRLLDKPWLCNGFTLGSHGEYFIDRKSTKNVQFPYGSYASHYCLCIIYDRNDQPFVLVNEPYQIDRLSSMSSIISNLEICVVEKWKIASDKPGSGNTKNIGSITRIQDIIEGKGVFSKLGESWFDDYWKNYKRLTITTASGESKQMTNLEDFVRYNDGDTSLIVPRNTKK